jgi:hypothetical protein
LSSQQSTWSHLALIPWWCNAPCKRRTATRIRLWSCSWRNGFQTLRAHPQRRSRRRSQVPARLLVQGRQVAQPRRRLVQGRQAAQPRRRRRRPHRTTCPWMPPPWSSAPQTTAQDSARRSPTGRRPARRHRRRHAAFERQREAETTSSRIVRDVGTRVLATGVNVASMQLTAALRRRCQLRSYYKMVKMNKK